MISFFYYVINICSKYAQVAPLKDEKGMTITNAFQKTCVDKDSEF